MLSTAQPAVKSRYDFPSVSKTLEPSPRTKTGGMRLHYLHVVLGFEVFVVLCGLHLLCPIFADWRMVSICTQYIARVLYRSLGAVAFSVCATVAVRNLGRSPRLSRGISTSTRRASIIAPMTVRSRI